MLVANPRQNLNLEMLAAREYIKEVIKVPTGEILIVHGEAGPLECMSLRDYGKERNIKADFLGLTREINGVQHGEMLPLESKWVITISTQYGCSMKCSFCDVPKVGPGKNASVRDMMIQFFAAMSMHQEVQKSKRINMHFARMGEPAFNAMNVCLTAERLANFFRRCKEWDVDYGFHPVVSTMMPIKAQGIKTFIHNWMTLKKNMEGEAGLQLSINSSSDEQRAEIFGGESMLLEDIAKVSSGLPKSGRKIALNFALFENSIIEGDKLAKLFSPEEFMCKITPMHETNACNDSNMHTPGGYVSYSFYRTVEENLKNAGFDVVVFIPSKEEDEGRITCGNAILSDKNKESKVEANSKDNSKTETS